jgi:hypothetical protein
MVVSNIDFSTSAISLAIFLVMSIGIVLGVSKRSLGIDSLSIIGIVTTGMILSDIDLSTST